MAAKGKKRADSAKKPRKPNSRATIPFDFDHVNGMELARAFGVTRPAVYNWQNAGCPRNPDRTFSVPDMVKWYVAREMKKAIPSDTAELSKERMEVDLELAKERLAASQKRVVMREKVEAVLGDMCRALVHYWTDRWLHNIPKMLKALGVGADRTPQIKTMMLALVKESMEHMKAEAGELKWENVRVPE